VAATRTICGAAPRGHSCPYPARTDLDCRRAHTRTQLIVEWRPSNKQRLHANRRMAPCAQCAHPAAQRRRAVPRDHQQCSGSSVHLRRGAGGCCRRPGHLARSFALTRGHVGAHTHTSHEHNTQLVAVREHGVCGCIRAVNRCTAITRGEHANHAAYRVRAPHTRTRGAAALKCESRCGAALRRAHV
jgi:hypothetical protein